MILISAKNSSAYNYPLLCICIDEITDALKDTARCEYYLVFDPTSSINRLILPIALDTITFHFASDKDLKLVSELFVNIK